MNIPNIIYFQSEKRKENLSYHSEIFSFVRFYDKKKKLVKLSKIYKNDLFYPKINYFQWKKFFLSNNSNEISPIIPFRQKKLTIFQKWISILFQNYLFSIQKPLTKFLRLFHKKKKKEKLNTQFPKITHFQNFSRGTRNSRRKFPCSYRYIP